jgi:hypothetical protein
MNDQIKAVLEAWQGFGASQVEPVPEVVKAAELSLAALVGLTYEQAEAALHITSSALRGAAVVRNS